MGWQCKESDDEELGECDEEALKLCEQSPIRYDSPLHIPLSDSSL